jgi:ribosomal-protein-alanine N-acetyltransferase
MNFNNINQNITQGDLLLRPILDSDINFINLLFQDSEIKKYYTVPNEIKNDYSLLINEWHNDVKKNAGTCWIIIKKRKDINGQHEQVGIVGIGFKDSFKNAKIGYALLPEFRNKGIISISLKLVIDILINEGVQIIEAEIDKDNLKSENVVRKLGFKKDKKTFVSDLKEEREGELVIKHLWKKFLNDFDISLLKGNIPIQASKVQLIQINNKIANEINTKGKHPDLLIRYYNILGRINYLDGKFDEANKLFNKSNIICVFESKPVVHENFYWFAKINEEYGDFINAKKNYILALDKLKFHPNPNYISKQEIEFELYKEFMDFKLINENQFYQLLQGSKIKLLEEEIYTDFNFFSPINDKKKTGKFHFVISSNVTEKLVGISNDNQQVFSVPWELIRVEEYQNNNYVIFTGWGDQANGINNPQFEDYEIGVDLFVFINFIKIQLNENPNFYSKSTVNNVIGLENFNF